MTFAKIWDLLFVFIHSFIHSTTTHTANLTLGRTVLPTVCGWDLFHIIAPDASAMNLPWTPNQSQNTKIPKLCWLSNKTASHKATKTLIWYLWSCSCPLAFSNCSGFKQSFPGWAVSALPVVLTQLKSQSHPGFWGFFLRYWRVTHTSL